MKPHSPLKRASTPSTKSHLLKFPPTPNSTNLEYKSLICKTWDIPDPNYSTLLILGTHHWAGHSRSPRKNVLSGWIIPRHHPPPTCPCPQRLHPQSVRNRVTHMTFLENSAGNGRSWKRPPSSGAGMAAGMWYMVSGVAHSRKGP
jgi:hypothetical protein